MRAYCLICARIFSRSLLIILLFVGVLIFLGVGIVRAAAFALEKLPRPRTADMGISTSSTGLPSRSIRVAGPEYP